jgi:hypothetical protein
MKITVLRTECANGRTCPQIAETEDGQLLFQGRIASSSGAEAVVRIPTTLTWGCDVSHLEAHGPDQVLVPGQRVTDLTVLDELRVPEWEIVVRAPRSVLPEVTATC